MKDMKLILDKWPETQPKADGVKMMSVEVCMIIVLEMILITVSQFCNDNSLILARNIVTGCALFLAIALAVYVFYYVKTEKLFYWDWKSNR